MRVCDPSMLYRPRTALAALKLGCHFIGVPQDCGCVERIRKEVAQNREKGEVEPCLGPSSAGTQGADGTAGTAIHQGSLFAEDGAQQPVNRSHANAGEKVQQLRQDEQNRETGE